LGSREVVSSWSKFIELNFIYWFYYKLAPWPTTNDIESCVQKLWDWRFGDAYPLILARECHRFCHGFTWGTGQGTDFCTPQKPVPVAWVDGFDPVSNSARNRMRLPAQHSKLCISAPHNHQPPQKHEQDNKGGGMGGGIHAFIPSEGMLSSIGHYHD